MTPQPIAVTDLLRQLEDPEERSTVASHERSRSSEYILDEFNIVVLGT
jgi:hypothetical protein